MNSLLYRLIKSHASLLIIPYPAYKHRVVFQPPAAVHQLFIMSIININHGRSAFEAALFLRILTQKCIRKPKFDPIRFLFRPIVKDDILRHRQTDQLFSIDVKSVSVNVFPVSVCKIIQTANRHIRIKAALMLI